MRRSCHLLFLLFLPWYYLIFLFHLHAGSSREREISSNSFHERYLNGSSPAIARPHDVTEHVYVAAPLLRWGWKRHGYISILPWRQHALTIDPGEPSSIHERGPVPGQRTAWLYLVSGTNQCSWRARGNGDRVGEYGGEGGGSWQLCGPRSATMSFVMAENLFNATSASRSYASLGHSTIFTFKRPTLNSEFRM